MADTITPTTTPTAPEKKPHGFYVVTRSGKNEPLRLDVITDRLRQLCVEPTPLHEDVCPEFVTTAISKKVAPGMTTSELDEMAARAAQELVTKHPDYSRLAGRVAASNLQKNIARRYKSFSAVVKALATYVHPITNQPAPLVSKQLRDIILEHGDAIDVRIRSERDFDFDYFAMQTLKRSYLLKMHDELAETPQYLYMREALGICGADLETAFTMYEYLSQGYYTHATPTMFNAGTPRPQMSSCFLLTMKEDSIDGIYDTLKQCACISKFAGGIGLSIHNIRALKSYIRGTNGSSNGIVPMLKVFNDTARYVDQGGGKRKGSFAIYLEPWHADIFEFLDAKKNRGAEETRIRDLFFGLWIPDLFMQRVKEDQSWSLFCPNEAPGLAECFGKDFEKLYAQYEATPGLARQVVPARKIWFSMLESQVETGGPYMLYKDACNSKSNQQHLGTIKSSNLCTEIVEYTSPEEVAVCNLASVALPKFLRKATADEWKAFQAQSNAVLVTRTGVILACGMVFDFTQFGRIVDFAIRRLDTVIDLNFYPIKEAETSNFRHRPVGLGVQGLADVFIRCRLPFDSPEARDLNRAIFEAMYYFAVNASVDMARVKGTFPTYAGSPTSQGKLQFDLWGVEPSPVWDWADVKARMAQHGIRNSLLIAPMPTASTAQIMGNTESIEPVTSNIFTRETLSGRFVLVNQHLVRDLLKLGLWDSDMYKLIIAEKGSVQRITAIPEHIRKLYRTVWELKQKSLIDLAADRGAFICQSQSLNLYMNPPDAAKMTAMHMYAWGRGLKTGQYYFRTKPARDAAPMTLQRATMAGVYEKYGVNVRDGGGGVDADSVYSGSARSARSAAEEQKEFVMEDDTTDKAYDSVGTGAGPSGSQSQVQASTAPNDDDEGDENENEEEATLVEEDGAVCVYIRKGQPVPEDCLVCGS